MQYLLSKDLFDRFLLVEAEIRRDITWQIDGRINPAFTGSDETPDPEFISWAGVRPHIYSIIKGKELPVSMKIVLALPGETVRDLMARSGAGPDAVCRGMYLNLLYRSSGLTVTTGIVMGSFSLDRGPEQLFDETILDFLRKNALL